MISSLSESLQSRTFFVSLEGFDDSNCENEMLPNALDRERSNFVPSDL